MSRLFAESAVRREWGRRWGGSRCYVDGITVIITEGVGRELGSGVKGLSVEGQREGDAAEMQFKCLDLATSLEPNRVRVWVLLGPCLATSGRVGQRTLGY